MHAELRRLKLRHLSTVVEVARAGSLTKAAGVLHVSVPAVSKTLREIRHELGMELFQLQRGVMTLTPQGEIFAAHARAGLEALQRGVVEARELSGAQGRSIRIAVMPHVALNFLPKVLALLAEQGPIDSIDIVSGTTPTAMQMLRHGEIDGVLARLASPVDMVGLTFEQLYTDALILVVRRGHPLLRQRNRSVGDLLRYTVVMPPGGTIARTEIEHLLSAAGLERLPRRIETMYVELPRQLALGSDVIWFAQSGSVAADIRSGALRVLFPDWEPPRSPVGITTRPGITPSDTMRVFITAAREAARAERSPGG